MTKKLLLLGAILFSALTSWAQTSPYTGVAPGDIKDGESYYLYNVDFGTWLGDNDRNTVFGWTSHAEIGKRGRDIKFIATNGGWQLDAKLNSGNALYQDEKNHSINPNLYMDTKDAVTVWTIEAIGGSVSNAVKIKNATTGLAVNDAGDMDQNADGGERHNKWQIVTREERLDNMKPGDDISWVVLGGTFPVCDDHRWDGSWQGDKGNNANGGDGKYHCNRVWEFWGITNRDIYQEIEVPNGVYSVGGRAIYVSTGNGDQNADRYNEYIANPEGNTKGYLYANNKETKMRNVYEYVQDSKVDNRFSKDLGNGKWSMDATNEFSANMFDGKGEVTPMTVCVTDGKLKVGFKVVDGTGSSWMLINNIDVKYLGDENFMNALVYMNGRGFDENEANNLNGDVNALKVRFKQFVADKSEQPTIFTDMQAATIGDQNHNDYSKAVDNLADGFYLYNVGTGRWFCGGADWGAHAAVGFPGIKVTTPRNDYRANENEVGRYNSIKTYLFNGNWNDGGLLNHSGYCDTGGNGWKFWTKDAGQGIYTIAKNGSNTGDNASNGYGTKELLGFNTNTIMEAVTNKVNADDPNNQWIFVTEAQRDAMAEAAVAAGNVADMTYKIKMPGFNQRERKEGSNQDGETLDWTCNHANYCYNASDNGSRKLIMDRGGNHADFVIDLYGGQWNDAFSWKQTISNLTPGKYRVKVQGYNSVDDVNSACLVANGKSKALRNRSSEAELPWQGYPGSTFEAPEYFQNGLYWNEVECTVTDGTLTLGIESPNFSGDRVCIFDNFRLEYLGGYVELDEASDNAVLNEKTHADVVSVKRNIATGKWNTFCVPFDMAIPAGWTVKELAGAAVEGENASMEFSDAGAIVAGKPYMVKVTEAVSEITAEDKDIVATPGSTTFNGVTYYGVFTSGKAPQGSFIINSNVFYLVDQADAVNLKAFRGYITVESSTPAKTLSYSFDDASLIEALEAQENANAEIFNLNGVKMNGHNLPMGIYIVNGKKVVIK